MKKCLVYLGLGFILPGLLLAGTITAVSPSGGFLLRGAPSMIKWKAKDTVNGFRITLWKNNVLVGVIKKNWEPGNGLRSFSWKVGEHEGGIASPGFGYKIKVKEKNKAIFGISQHEFEIRKPVFKPPSGLFKPKIESWFGVPMGALKKGTRLILKGELFGNKKGKILMYGQFPTNPVELVNVKWVNSSQVEGFIPDSVNGCPNQTVQIRVQRVDKVLSNAWGNIGFVGRYEKMINYKDVTLIACGTDSNIEICNTWADDAHWIHALGGEVGTIGGVHINSWGAIGDDKGTDVYLIELKNGWKFTRVKMSYKKSSSDEKFEGPMPPLPKGGSKWSPAFTWLVTPDDKVLYILKVYADGPLGTNYK